ncbi:zinc ion-binding protein [Salvia divinorum]|uniref:Zinc ion-binding protein n=1 Tax=Salvia divinorum TaxID=28513 RepID=A0ABD1GXE3_SALDI
MVDLQTVCCMCGDVGFPDKLFRCSKCRNRFQHSYCSNYYSEYAEPIEICDWCQCEERNLSSSSSSSRHGNSTRNNKHANEARSSDKIKHQRSEDAARKTPSPRPSARRYKLLKDVMC